LPKTATNEYDQQLFQIDHEKTGTIILWAGCKDIVFLKLIPLPPKNLPVLYRKTGQLVA
jgi:hypothetical protein